MCASISSKRWCFGARRRRRRWLFPRTPSPSPARAPSDAMPCSRLPARVDQDDPARRLGAARVKVVPLGCAVARRVQPIAHGLHAVIPESRCLHCCLLAKRGHKYRLSAVTVTHYHRVMGGTPFRDLAEQRAGPRPRATRSRPRQCALLSQAPPTHPRHVRPDAGAYRASTATRRRSRRRSPGAPRRQH